MLRQQGDVPTALRRVRRIFRNLAVAQLLRFLQHQLFRGLGHGASIVENLGDRVAGQAAGVGDLLHRYSFDSHSVHSQVYFFQINYTTPLCKKQDVQNVNHSPLQLWILHNYGHLPLGIFTKCKFFMNSPLTFRKTCRMMTLKDSLHFVHLHVNKDAGCVPEQK